MFLPAINRSIFPELTSNIQNCSAARTSPVLIQCRKQHELLKVLELLNTTNDINLQLKIFSSLSAYIMYKRGADINIIIKCNAIYDKIHYVLEKGLPRRASDALNFLSTLLFIDAAGEETTTKKALALYARNMTRLSGCLATMCEMFTGSMMYHDTWRALCQCLAVACSECEPNQSYCTHLIPICIRKCNQENIDLILVLQALLMNHNRNIKLFIECDGISIFTRELLHYDKCLHLLITLVQCSETTAALIRRTRILDFLSDFIRLYGPNSQIGQKSVIILNHISSRVKDTTNKRIHTPEHNKTILKTDFPVSNNINQIPNDLDETKVLMQNVMKEIFQWKQNEIKFLKSPKNTNSSNIIKVKTVSPEQISNKPEREKYTAQCDAEDLSFSFLTNNEQTDKTQMSVDTTAQYNTLLQSKSKHTIVDLQDFRPKFVSTPKKLNKVSENVTNINNDKVESIDTISIRNSQKKHKLYKIRQKRYKRKIEKRSSKREFDKDIKNRSLSSRFFSAINDSCTTIVKTVKNIFTTKKDASESSSERKIENHSCSYSFMKYMKQRDALLNNKYNYKNMSKFSNDTNSCQTCDDTQTLKRKFVNDEKLKQTIKKLKLGINLYGCDFKKISRTMWPRESYMTPAVLYNLYRKLILK